MNAIGVKKLGELDTISGVYDMNAGDIGIDFLTHHT